MLRRRHRPLRPNWPDRDCHVPFLLLLIMAGVGLRLAGGQRGGGGVRRGGGGSAFLVAASAAERDEAATTRLTRPSPPRRRLSSVAVARQSPHSECGAADSAPSPPPGPTRRKPCAQPGERRPRQAAAAAGRLWAGRRRIPGGLIRQRVRPRGCRGATGRLGLCRGRGRITGSARPPSGGLHQPKPNRRRSRAAPGIARQQLSTPRRGRFPRPHSTGPLPGLTLACVPPARPRRTARAGMRAASCGEALPLLAARTAFRIFGPGRVGRGGCHILLARAASAAILLAHFLRAGGGGCRCRGDHTAAVRPRVPFSASPSQRPCQRVCAAAFRPAAPLPCAPSAPFGSRRDSIAEAWFCRSASAGRSWGNAGPRSFAMHWTADIGQAPGWTPTCVRRGMSTRQDSTITWADCVIGTDST